MVGKLAITVSAAAPCHEYSAIWAELDDSSATLIQDIYGAIGVNGDASGTVKSRVRTSPLGHESPVGSKLLHTVIGSLCHINVAEAIDCEPIRFSEMSMALAARSDAGDKNAAW